MPYVVESFVRSNGECPYEEFLARVRHSGEKTGRITALVDRLASAGFDLASTGLAEHMDEELWQLKPKPYRVFFFWQERRGRFVLLNGYRKQSKRTPKGQMNKAKDLLQESKLEG